VKRPGQWLWALAVLALLTGCGPALPPVTPTGTNAPASPATRKGAGEASATEGTTKGFKFPEYDTENRLKSMLTGAEARPQGGDLILIRSLRVETYDQDGKVDMIVEAPECLFDRKNKSARSAGSMEARSANGLFRVTGRGFEWDQAGGRLVITNDSRTEISKQMMDQKTPQP
jgi:predicted small lipoprotein YifL